MSRVDCINEELMALNKGDNLTKSDFIIQLLIENARLRQQLEESNISPLRSNFLNVQGLLKSPPSPKTSFSITNEETFFMICSFMDALNTPILIADAEGRIIYFNETCRQITGYSLDKVKGNVCTLAVHDGDCEGYYSGSAPAGYSDNRWVTSDGRLYQVFWLKSIFTGDSGDVVLLIAIGLDITEQNVMEEALRESEERYRKLAEKLGSIDLPQSEERFSKIFHNSPDMMAIVRVYDDRFIEINQRFLDVTGYTRKELQSPAMKEQYLWLNNSDNLAHFSKQLFSEGIVNNLEINIKTKSGKIINTLTSVQLIDFNGDLCMLAVIKDVTQEKKLEAELARIDRLNLIGEMAASIGHEIRNPITAVRGFLQILKDEPVCHEYHGFYELMMEELDRANGILSNFLNISRDKTVELKPGSLDNVVMTLQPMIQAEALMNDKEVNMLLGGTPLLMIEEKEIRQLILNLVRNGLEAMPPRKTLTIGTLLEDSQVVLFVQDQGCGIDHELAEKIGTPFVTNKDNGTGLGLAVCYRIASHHSARIDFETGPQGTTFYVRFPVVQTEPQ